MLSPEGASNRHERKSSVAKSLFSIDNVVMTGEVRHLGASQRTPEHSILVPEYTRLDHSYYAEEFKDIQVLSLAIPLTIAERF